LAGHTTEPATPADCAADTARDTATERSRAAGTAERTTEASADATTADRGASSARAAIDVDELVVLERATPAGGSQERDRTSEEGAETDGPKARRDDALHARILTPAAFAAHASVHSLELRLRLCSRLRFSG
jgi:hypothetical protein